MDQTEHYFSRQPQAPERPARWSVRVREEEFTFLTSGGMFSRERLDNGTRLLLKEIELPDEGDFLDVGAGYGAIGIVLARLRPRARVVMVEVNERAAALAAENAQLNRAEKAEVRVGDAREVLGDGQFDLIATNPPIRAGKAVVVALIADAAARLRPGGSLWLVARTHQGARSLAEAMAAHLPRVELRARGSGYRLFAGWQEQP
jgi:16S rRNA (guanine1207-N2)-methyltransferase